MAKTNVLLTMNGLIPHKDQTQNKMADRKISPYINTRYFPNILPHTRKTLSNGIEVIIINDPAQEVFKMDVIFEAGINHQTLPLTASTAINMLNEGTKRHPAEQIAETFDYYGAYVDFNCGLNKSELNLISLNKYAKETISMLAEMVGESIFPEKEFEIYLRNKRQQFLVDIEKISYLARKQFSVLLFGVNHPYANVISEKDYEQASLEEIRNFYRERINARNCRIMLSGNIDDTVLNIVEHSFSSLVQPVSTPPEITHEFSPAPAGRYEVNKDGTVQSSLRIGKKALTLLDEDYANFQLLNTVLGGYFGSRLMSNIREEKGYTYGINSFCVSMPKMGYWCIATDVNNDYTEATISEVLKEIRKLQTELIPEDELTLVKNYLQGDLLRELDGVFSQSDALKHKLNYGLDNRVYLSMLDRINRCDSKELMDLANKYMNTDELYIVTAGNIKK